MFALHVWPESRFVFKLRNLWHSIRLIQKTIKLKLGGGQSSNPFIWRSPRSFRKGKNARKTRKSGNILPSIGDTIAAITTREWYDS